MATLNVDRIPKSPRAANWGYFSIEVDSTDVDGVLDHLGRALDATSLLLFLRESADPYFQEEILMRFAFEGDAKSGDWERLSPTTQRIRSALGYGGDGPINERTGELLEFAVYHRDFMFGPDWASMSVPGDPTTDSVKDKLEHAQMGTSDNPLFPGAYTPPRPVLATDESDMMMLLKMLEMHIMKQLAGSL